MSELSINEFKDFINTENVRFSDIVKRKYIPITEKESIISGIIELIKSANGNDGVMPNQNNTILNAVLFTTEAIKSYINVDFNADERLSFYDAICERNLYEIEEAIGFDYYDFRKIFYERLDDERKYSRDKLLIKNFTIVSEFDKIVEPVTTLLSALTEKIGEIDAKKLNKKLGSINIDSIIQAYTKTDLFKRNKDEIINARDEQIRKLNEQLNQYTAKNVMAEK